MRVLIDECIDERFRHSLPEHDCQTARYAGLAGLKNGELLLAAETAKFDVFLTVDQGIEYQQNLTGRIIAISIFRTKSNRLKDLLPHARACLAYMESIQPGSSKEDCWYFSEFDQSWKYAARTSYKLPPSNKQKLVASRVKTQTP
jgi:hypothetical protein